MHELTIDTDARARYPHKAVCTCGWQSRGYLTRQAAENVGQAHVDEVNILEFGHRPAS